MENEFRLIAVMYDGTVVQRDYTQKPDGPSNPLHWFNDYNTVHMANLVVCIHLASGNTEVVKNRWGDRGRVSRDQ